MAEYLDAVAYLDICILLELAALIFVAVLAYLVEPHWDPQRRQKLSFFAYCSGAWVYPLTTDPTMPTLKDFPDSKGTETYNTQQFLDHFESLWSPTGNVSLFRTSLIIMLPTFVTFFFVRAPREFSAFLDAYILACIVNFVDGTHGMDVGMKLIAVAVFQKLIASFVHSHSWLVVNHGLRKVYMPLQILCFRKLRNLGPEGLVKTSAAELQQLMKDIGDDLWLGLGEPGLKMVPIQAIRLAIVVWQLSKLYGVMAFTTSVIAVSGLVYLQSLTISGAQAAQDRSRTSSRSRLALLHELTHSLLPLKLYGWACGYLAPLAENGTDLTIAAKHEVWWRVLGDLFGGAVGDVFCISAVFVSVFVSGAEVDVQSFVMAQVFTKVGQECIDDFRSAHRRTTMLHKLLGRAEAFLRLPETEGRMASGSAIAVRGNFSWPSLGLDSMEWQQVLFSLDLHLKPGELVVVSGPIRAGKSSLLLSCLGETQCTGGQVQLPLGPVAYQPQVPHLLEGTIMHNITLGEDDANIDAMDLQTALIASQLGVDMDDERSTLHQLREHTQVGINGQNISGGQRARVALARTVYAVLRGASLALLDDPVAPVDNELAAAAWREAVVKTMHGATRVVVVGSQLLARFGTDADRVILLEEGRVAYDGPPAGIDAHSELLARLGEGYVLNQATSSPEKDRRPSLKSAVHAIIAAKDLSRMQPRAAANVEISAEGSLKVPQVSSCAIQYKAQGFVEFLSNTAGMREFLSAAAFDVSSETPPLPLSLERCQSEPARALAQQTMSRVPTSLLSLSLDDWSQLRAHLLEFQKQNQPKESTGTSSIKSASELQICLMFFRRQLVWVLGAMGCAFLAKLAVPAAIQLLQAWENRTTDLNSGAAFAGFASLALSRVVLQCVGEVLNGQGMAKNSMTLRGEVDRTLVRLSMPYFWRGGSVDDILAVVTTDLAEFSKIAILPGYVATSLAGLAAVVYSMPSLLLIVALAAWAYPKTGFAKDWAWRALIPLIPKARSTVLMHKAAEEFENRVVIRALGHSSHFDGIVQRSAMKIAFVEYALLSSMVLSNMLSALVDFLMVSCALVTVMQIKESGGDAARAIVLYNLVLGLSTDIVRLQTRHAIAAEAMGKYRLLEDFFQTDFVEDILAGLDAPPSWPSAGMISFQNVSFRYGPHMPYAMRDFTVTLRSGEKIGVVGPTGSGKSTMLNLLFRLGPLKGVAPSSGGKVTIDGVDIADVKLQDLRRALGVVPQEPVLFVGSLRANLGRESVADAEALMALRSVGLGKLANPASLSKELKGSDLSLGEMQLFAMARALLRRPRVLLLDEATSALDKRTAIDILNVLAEQAGRATVISVAHRLGFVLGCDRVIVLKRGGILEAFEAPAKLQKGDGYFAHQLRYEQQHESDGA